MGQQLYPNFTPEFFTTFAYNNNDSLTSNSSDSNFSILNIGQGIPPVYDQFRLVSASLIVVKYIGRMNITSGVIGGI